MLTQPHLRRTSGGPKSHYRENKILYYNQSAIKRQDAGGQILQDAEQAWWGNQMLDLWCSGALFFSTKSFERRLENFYICSCPAQMVLEIACVNLSQSWSRGHRFHNYWPRLQGWGANLALAWQVPARFGIQTAMVWWRQHSPCNVKPTWLHWAWLRHKQVRDRKALCPWHGSDSGTQWVWSVLANCHGLSPTRGSPTPALQKQKSPVSTRQDAEELPAVMEVSRITDTWQAKLLEENPFWHGCSEMGSNPQPRRDNSPVPAKALLVCSPCSLPASKCSSALTLPLLCPCLMLCTGRVTASQKPTQMFLNSRLIFQQRPTTCAVLLLLTVLGCFIPQVDLLQDCKERDKN